MSVSFCVSHMCNGAAAGYFLLISNHAASATTTTRTTIATCCATTATTTTALFLKECQAGVHTVQPEALQPQGIMTEEFRRAPRVSLRAATGPS